jgi:hypothetical protein
MTEGDRKRAVEREAHRVVRRWFERRSQPGREHRIAQVSEFVHPSAEGETERIQEDLVLSVPAYFGSILGSRRHGDVEIVPAHVPADADDVAPPDGKYVARLEVVGLARKVELQRRARGSHQKQVRRLGLDVVNEEIQIQRALVVPDTPVPLS